MIIQAEVLAKMVKNIKTLILIEIGLLLIILINNIFSLTSKSIIPSEVAILLPLIAGLPLIYFGIRYLSISYTGIETIILGKKKYDSKWLIFSFLIPFVNLVVPVMMLKEMNERYDVDKKGMKTYLPLLITYEIIEVKNRHCNCIQKQ